jgi:hypothetical protein
MEFDDLQKAWQSQNLTAQVTIKADLLLKEVRRNQLSLRATLFWRDVREVSAAILLTAWFSFDGWRHHASPDYLCAIICAGVGIFMIADRFVQKKTQPVFSGSLKSCLEASLAQVIHQIWLLKNVFWWYLLPLLVASAISMAYTNSHLRHFDKGAAVGAMLATLLVAWFFVFVYRLNQTAVKKSLEPRRLELEALMATLGSPHDGK